MSSGDSFLHQRKKDETTKGLIVSASVVKPTAAKPARAKKKVAKDYIPPSPYTFRAAMAKGDVFTRVSLLIWGLGNLARKQIVKGILWLVTECLFIWYFIAQGFPAIKALPQLGTKSSHYKDADGFWHYRVPTPSVVVLLYGVCAIVLLIVFVWFWALEVRSAYKAQCQKKELGKASSFRQDVYDLFDARGEISLMFLPVLGIFVFTVLPLIFMISMAFTSYDQNHVSKFDWVGLVNFKTVFSNNIGSGGVNLNVFMDVLVWTLVWAFFATFLNFFLGMFLSMIIERKTTKGKPFWRGLFSMSIAVPQFVSLLVMNQMLQQNGAINRLLESWGWISGPLPFFTNTTWARVTVIVINLWVGIPFTMMQITGILENIPAELYEAAKIDGANWWQQFTNVTMPYIMFVLTPYLITTFAGNVNNFNVIYLLSGGDPTPVGSSAGKTDLLITWLYKLTVDQSNYNLGAVIGICTFIVLAVVSLITYHSSGSYKNEEAFR